MIKVWQYKSKLTSEPWITIKRNPTEYELNAYKKYRYELRQIEIENTSDLIDYEDITLLKSEHVYLVDPKTHTKEQDDFYWNMIG